MQVHLALGKRPVDAFQVGLVGVLGVFAEELRSTGVSNFVETMNGDLLEQRELRARPAAGVGREGGERRVGLLLQPLGEGIHQFLLAAVPIDLEHVQRAGAATTEVAAFAGLERGTAAGHHRGVGQHFEILFHRGEPFLVRGILAEGAFAAAEFTVHFPLVNPADRRGGKFFVLGKIPVILGQGLFSPFL